MYVVGLKQILEHLFQFNDMFRVIVALSCYCYMILIALKYDDAISMA